MKEFGESRCDVIGPASLVVTAGFNPWSEEQQRDPPVILVGAPMSRAACTS